MASALWVLMHINEIVVWRYPHSQYLTLNPTCGEDVSVLFEISNSAKSRNKHAFEWMSDI